jgi:hypothetical protein
VGDAYVQSVDWVHEVVAWVLELLCGEGDEAAGVAESGAGDVGEGEAAGADE